MHMYKYFLPMLFCVFALTACNSDNQLSLDVGTPSSTPTVPGTPTTPPSDTNTVTTPSVAEPLVLQDDVDNFLANLVLGQRNAPVAQPTTDALTSWSLLAPGSGGSGAPEPLCAFCTNQMELYNNIIFREKPLETTADINKYFKRADIEWSSKPILTKFPRADFNVSEYNRLAEAVSAAGFKTVTEDDIVEKKLVARVEWDEFAIPRIVGDTIPDVTLGLGYATGLSHSVEMELFKFIGQSGLLLSLPVFSFGSLDFSTILDAIGDIAWVNYSREELMDSLVDICKLPEYCADIISLGTSYTTGINMAIKTTTPIYNVLDLLGLPWPKFYIEDTMSIGLTMLDIFGNKPSPQLYNIETYLDIKKLGFNDEDALELLKDYKLETTEVPENLVTLKESFPHPIYSDGTNETDKDRYIDPASIAMVNPDTFRPYSDSAAPVDSKGLLIPNRVAKMSNFVALSADKSATGYPMLIGGPQMGYFRPNVFMEYKLQTTDPTKFNLAGVSVPGLLFANFAGKTNGRSWTPTAPNAGISDKFAEKLCWPDGVTDEFPKYYEYKGECIAMIDREAGTPFTVHGPVMSWGETVDGTKIAMSRKSYNTEQLGSTLIPFYRLGTGEAKSGQDFIDIMKDFALSTHMVYIDSKDIAYVQTGIFPVRAEGSQFTFPTWGTGEWDWQGPIPEETRPHAVNPPNGMLAQWNNSAAYDFYYHPGIVQRVTGLTDPLEKLDKVSLGEFTEIVSQASTQNLHYGFVMPTFLKVLGDQSDLTDRQREMLTLVTEWGTEEDDEAQLVDWNRDGIHDDQGPVILETLISEVVDEMSKYTPVPLLNDLNPANEAGSAYGGVSVSQIKHYMERAFENGENTETISSTRFQCNSGTASSCRELIITALNNTDTKLSELFETTNIDQWFANKPGLLTIPFPAEGESWHWQNRPTYQILSTTLP